MRDLWEMCVCRGLEWGRLTVSKVFTFFNPETKGSESDPAEEVGGVGGILLQNPQTAMTQPTNEGMANSMS